MCPAVKGVKGYVSKQEAEHIHISSSNNSDFATDLVDNLKNQRSRNQKVITDLRRPYYPSSNIYQSSSTATSAFRGKLFTLRDLDAWMNYSVGVGYQATWGVSEDTVKNGFEFIDDPDKEDAKAIKQPNITKWLRSSGFIDMLWYWQSYNLGMGIGFSLGHWRGEMDKVDDIEGVMKGFTKKNFRNRKDFDKYHEPPPTRPPDRFEVINPLYFQPTGSSLTKSNRLNYDEELWEFTGGGIKTKTRIHKDRVFVLRTHELSAFWRGLSTFDPVRFSILGYFNNIIYIQRGIQNWGDTIMALFYGTKFPTVVEQKKILAVLDAYEMGGKIHLPEQARLEPITVEIGRGIKSAMEIYVEDLAGKWRIPKNQLLGRSEGGGLTEGPAKISKDDYYERIGSDQRKLTYPIMKQYIWRFFPDTDNLWLRWHLNTYKSDEQRLREEGLGLDNQIKQQQIREQKIKVKMLQEERTMMLLDGAMKARGLGIENNKEKSPEIEGQEPRKISQEDFIEFKDYIERMNISLDNGGIKH